jgi:hypothetical protein
MCFSNQQELIQKTFARVYNTSTKDLVIGSLFGSSATNVKTKFAEKAKQTMSGSQLLQRQHR